MHKKSIFCRSGCCPKEENITPRYDQQRFLEQDRKNKFQFIVSPIGSSHSGVKINQDAYFALTDLSKDKDLEYQVQHEGNGLYIFVLEGSVQTAEETLSQRDAVSLTGVTKVGLVAAEDAKILVMEVPVEV
jgi:redox-sensitive bicupin YhaK (pirin superfamily)